jgi:hypothetical protein
MPDTTVEPPGGGPYHPALEARVSRLEDDVHDMTATLSRLEMSVAEIKAMLSATLPHLATKAELAELRLTTKSDLTELRLATTSDFAELRLATSANLTELRVATTSEFAALRADLAEKPGKTYMWGVLTALLTAYACGLAALAILK